MELEIRAKNLNLTPEIKDYVEKKSRRISRHLPSVTKVMVELSSQRARAPDQRVAAQLTLDIDGVILRGEERGQNAAAALDAALDLIDRRIERFKSKVYRSERGRRAARREQAKEMSLEESVSPEDEAEGTSVVRYKTYPIKPMPVEEAVHQMELLGHDFFLFMNSDADSYNVLYRRRDGDYGLIQPELL